jgi:hypothetical protein
MLPRGSGGGNGRMLPRGSGGGSGRMLPRGSGGGRGRIPCSEESVPEMRTAAEAAVVIKTPKTTAKMTKMASRLSILCDTSQASRT